MTREEINKISLFEPHCFETVEEEIWYQMGCIDGLEAADKEPNTSALWHDASEEPKKGELILVEVVNTIPESKDIRYFVEYAAEWVLNCIKTEGFKCRWAYISDLLPKGGEE